MLGYSNAMCTGAYWISIARMCGGMRHLRISYTMDLHHIIRIHSIHFIVDIKFFFFFFWVRTTVEWKVFDRYCVSFREAALID
jgi:hypothetical protein